VRPEGAQFTRQEGARYTRDNIEREQTGAQVAAVPASRAAVNLLDGCAASKEELELVV
jgi:hypothetical protein